MGLRGRFGLFETYEEHAGKALEVLYPGALFLNAGDQKAAEQLLIDTMASSFHEWDDPVEPTVQWFEARMAARFGASVQPPPAEGPASAHLTPVPTVRREDLLAAVAAIPEGARAALWLVLLRQWSYADATKALGVTPESLRQMLEYRHALTRQLLGRSSRNEGTQGGLG